MTIRNRIKGLKQIPAGKLQAHPENWRRHPQQQADTLRGLMGDIGFASALLVRPLKGGKYQILDGHLRAEITPDESLPCLVTDLDEHEARKLLATFDPVSAMAEGDADQLGKLLASVESDDQNVRDLLERLGQEFGVAAEEPAQIVEDEIPDKPKRPVTRAGDVWEMDRHRLLCGDSTKLADVRKLMGGQRASCVFTDPPYGVGIGAKNRFLNSVQKAGRCLENIQDDSLSPEELKQRLLPAFVLLRQHVMAEDCTLFVSAPQGGELGMMMMMMMIDAGLPVRHMLIWKKNQPTFSMGRLDYDYQHEPILLTWGKRHKRPHGGRPSDVRLGNRPRAEVRRPPDDEARCPLC